MENLRVCWESREDNLNCGHCEKCLRTMTNFLACGLEIPACFKGGENLLRKIKKMRLGSYLVIGEWGECVAEAKNNGISGTWIKDVKRMIGRSRRRLNFTHRRRQLKKQFKKTKT
jgi:hypothetical protein